MISLPLLPPSLGLPAHGCGLPLVSIAYPPPRPPSPPRLSRPYVDEVRSLYGGFALLIPHLKTAGVWAVFCVTPVLLAGCGVLI